MKVDIFDIWEKFIDIVIKIVKWGLVVFIVGTFIYQMYYGFRYGFESSKDDGEPKQQWDRYLY